MISLLHMRTVQQVEPRSHAWSALQQVYFDFMFFKDATNFIQMGLQNHGVEEQSCWVVQFGAK